MFLLQLAVGLQKVYGKMHITISAVLFLLKCHEQHHQNQADIALKREQNVERDAVVYHPTKVA